MIQFREAKVDTNGGITVEYTENGEIKSYQCFKDFSVRPQEYVEFVNDEFDRDKEFDTRDDLTVEMAYYGALHFKDDEDFDDEDEEIKCFKFKSITYVGGDSMILEFQEDDEVKTYNLFNFKAFESIKEEDRMGLVRHLNANDTLVNKLMTDSFLFLLIGITTIAKRYLNNITEGDETEEIGKDIAKAVEAMF